MAGVADVESTALHRHSKSLIAVFHLIDKVKLSKSLGEKGIIDLNGVLTPSHVRVGGHKWCNEALLESIENGVKANHERFNNLLAELKRQAQVEQAEPDVNRDGTPYLKEHAQLMRVTRELEQTYRKLYATKLCSILHYKLDNMGAQLRFLLWAHFVPNSIRTRPRFNPNLRARLWLLRPLQ